MTSADVRWRWCAVEVVFDEGTIYRDLVQSGVEQMTVPGMLWKFKKIWSLTTVQKKMTQPAVLAIYLSAQLMEISCRAIRPIIYVN